MSAVTACGVCCSAPKKYKCPNCALPYCSIVCFKEHKLAHIQDDFSPSGSRSASSLDVPVPLAPAIPISPALSLLPPAPPNPVPKYLRAKADFSRLANDPQFQLLLRSHPSLLPTLQRIYAATIEPEEDSELRERGMRGRGALRGRWRGSRGRGGGRGGRGTWGGQGDRPRWTQRQGDKDAMRMLKSLRDGSQGHENKEDMEHFVKLVGDMFRDGQGGSEGDQHIMGCS